MNGRSDVEPVPDDDPLGPLVESFLDRFRRGERPSLTEMVDRHPELSGQIRELIPALVELEQLGVATGSFGGEAAKPYGVAEIGGLEMLQRLGDYRILRKIGGGGMGVVYEAEHESLKSRVALKVVLPRYRNNQKYLRRFHVEARSAAGLHHTNIVSVFDYAEQDGVCYYAMQYIEGQPLDRVLADLRILRKQRSRPGRPITAVAVDGDETVPIVTFQAVKGLMTGHFARPPELDETTVEPARFESKATAVCATTVAEPDRRDDAASGVASTVGSSSLGGSGEGRYYVEIARLCAQVADALEYAHRRGVLHRDIKPSNLLLDILGNVWVTDFGLAKLEECDDLSQSHELVGTLPYMAPERFRGTSDRRTDVYALGATLYELLVLQPAFLGSDQVRLIERIKNERPIAPRKLEGNVPRDLETIVLKTLAKDPKDRFATAGELAQELRRFVEGRPIRSRPVWAVERFWRWCKRDPMLAGSSVAAAVLTAVLAIGSMTAAYVYREQADALKVQTSNAVRAAREARGHAVNAYTAQANAGRFSRRPGQRFESLKAIAEALKLLDQRVPGWEAQRDKLRDLAISALALPDIRVSRTFGRVSGVSITHCDIDPDFERFAWTDSAGNCIVSRAADGCELHRFLNTGDALEGTPHFSPDGRYLTLLQIDGRLRIWKIDQAVPSQVAEAELNGKHVASVNFRHDGAVLAITISDGLGLIDLKTGRIQSLPQGEGRNIFTMFHPDGHRLATVSERGGNYVAAIRELGDSRPITEIIVPAPIHDADLSPDGRRLALAGGDSRLYIWEVDRPGSTLRVMTGLNSQGLTVAFNHRGDLLASNGWEGILRLWDPATGQQLLNLPGFSSLRFSRDDRFIGCGRMGESLRTFEIASGRELRTLPGGASQDHPSAGLSISPDGRVLADQLMQGVRFWDLDRNEVLSEFNLLQWPSSKFEADGSLVTFDTSGIFRWPLRRAGREWKFGPPRVVTGMGQFGGHLSLSQGSRVIGASYFYSGAYIFRKDRPGAPLNLGGQDDVRGVAVSPNGRWAATVSHHGPESGVGIWDIEAGVRVASLAALNGGSTAFSPDGRWIVTSAGQCKVWEVGTWRLSRELDAESGDIVFHPDSSQLAVCYGTQLRLYNPATGRRLATLEAPESGKLSIPIFSPDGRRLAVSNYQTHAIHVWDLGLIRSDLAALGLDWDAPSPPSSDPVRSSDPLSLVMDLGWLEGTPQGVSPEEFARRSNEYLVTHPNAIEDLHQRGHVLLNRNRHEEALADFSAVLAKTPNHAHIRAVRGSLLLTLKRFKPALDDLELVLTEGAEPLKGISNLAGLCNDAGWELCTGSLSVRDPSTAVRLAKLALVIEPENAMYRNTLGVAQYRKGQYTEAVSTLEKNLKAADHTTQSFDLIFLAMAHHQLGHPGRARACFKAAEQWLDPSKGLEPVYRQQLPPLLAEAKAVMDRPPSELPIDVFAPR